MDDIPQAASTQIPEREPFEDILWRKLAIIDAQLETVLEDQWEIERRLSLKLDRLLERAAGEPGTGSSTTPTCGNTEGESGSSSK